MIHDWNAPETMEEEQLRQRGAERLRPMMQLRDTMEIERLRMMGSEERQRENTLISILIILILCVSIVLVSIGGDVAYFGYLFTLLFFCMVGISIYLANKSSEGAKILYVPLIIFPVSSLIISMGEYVAYFGYLLALVCFCNAVVAINHFRWPNSAYIPLIIYILLIIFPVSLILMSMGGYIARFSYLLALLCLCMVLYVIFVLWMVGLANGWARGTPSANR